VKPVRIRDFVRDDDNWLYAVAAYDNSERVGCLLRYIPDPSGDRIDSEGEHYRKVEFEEAFNLIKTKRPDWADLVQRIPLREITEILKPDERLVSIASSHSKVAKLVSELNLPNGSFGVTGSLLCGLGTDSSDIDGVVYGDAFEYARLSLQRAVERGTIEALDETLWKAVYKKRNPDTSYDEFVHHERRKWNRGQIEGTYFDLLYSRAYDELSGIRMMKGEVLGRTRLVATVTGDRYVFDSPALYEIDHPEVSKILSFTHTYTGQAFAGEDIEARGVLERHGSEIWLIVGTTREAKGEWIRSLTLLEDL